jgi:hypothetical protein
MTTILRAARVIATVLVLALAGAASVRAADATLGATVQSKVYVNDSRALQFQNLSTVRAVFTFAPSGGWRTDPPTVTLGPTEVGSVTIVGDDADGSKIGVTVTSADPTPQGESRTALAFTATIYHAAPFDLAQWAWRALWGVGTLLVVLRLLVAVRRVTRRYSLRLERKQP